MTVIKSSKAPNGSRPVAAGMGAIPPSAANGWPLSVGKYSRTSSIFSACRFAATRTLISSRSCVRRGLLTKPCSFNPINPSVLTTRTSPKAVWTDVALLSNAPRRGATGVDEVQPVAIGTAEHNKAALGHAKLTQGSMGIYAALRRLSACDKSQVDCRFIHNRAEVPRASPRSSAASAVTPRLPRTNSLSRAFVHPILRAKAACVIFPGCRNSSRRISPG